MSQSSLATVHIWTNHIGYSPDGSHGRGGKKIDKIFVHHMAGILTAEQCGNVFKTREASAHYGVDKNGRIGQYVKEEDTAWHCANKSYNQRSIGIELSNDGGANTNWHVSDKVIARAIDLIVDICKRNGIKKINYTGDLSGNLCMHRWTASTSCPGGYLAGKFKYIAEQVNKKLAVTPTPSSELYRVRKTWADAKSQVGAYKSLANAKKVADEKHLTVFDSKGNAVYPKSTKKKYTGTLPTLKLVKTNAQVINDTIGWAKWIAGDNHFHYGYGKHAHHNGCYFCGTQSLKKGHGIKEYEHTYCCNPFVHACFAHGGGDDTALKICKKRDSWGFSKNDSPSYEKSSLFTKLGHPAKSTLKAGDVLCNDNHVALYIGNGKLAEASGGDDNVVNSKKWNNSIHITDLTDSRYKGFKRVYRYKGSVNVSRPLEVGEISDRAKCLNDFLIWYGYKITSNRIFSDSTEDALKKFQKAVNIKVDGIVGQDTINAMKRVEK